MSVTGKPCEEDHIDIESLRESQPPTGLLLGTQLARLRNVTFPVNVVGHLFEIQIDAKGKGNLKDLGSKVLLSPASLLAPGQLS